MWILLNGIVAWLLREVVIKFVILTAMVAVVGFVIPRCVNLVSPWVGTSALNTAFSGVPSTVWFFADAFEIGYGLPLLISAYVARFLIRRLPFVG
jgi:hypothetical protein